MLMRTPSKKQSGPAWLDNLEITSAATSPKHTTSRAGSAAESTSSRPTATTDSLREPQAAFPRKQWLTITSFNDGDLIAGAHISQWNVVRLRRIGKMYALSRNNSELSRFDRLEKAIDAFERATHGVA